MDFIAANRANPLIKSNLQAALAEAGHGRNEPVINSFGINVRLIISGRLINVRYYIANKYATFVFRMECLNLYEIETVSKYEIISNRI